VLEEARPSLVRADDAAGLDLRGEEARRRERAPVVGARTGEGTEDAAVGVEDAAVGVAERPGIGL
jgi:hypothetical protein